MTNNEENSETSAKDETIDLSLGAYCRLPSINKEDHKRKENLFLFEVSILHELNEEEFLKRVELIFPELEDADMVLRTVEKYYEIHYPSKKDSMLRLFQHIISNHAILRHSLKRNE